MYSDWSSTPVPDAWERDLYDKMALQRDSKSSIKSNFADEAIRDSPWTKGDLLDTTTRGISPCELIGKVLIRLQRSPNHPAITLYFEDESVYQIRVDGYNPQHPGLPKQLEVDPSLEEMLFNKDNGRSGLSYTIENAVVTTLKDRATDCRNSQDVIWDQFHAAVAFRFQE